MRLHRAMFKPGKFNVIVFEWCRQYGKATGRIAHIAERQRGCVEVWFEA